MREARHWIGPAALVLLAAVSAGGVRAQEAPPARGSVYAGPVADPSFSAIASELITALYPEQRLTLVAVAGSDAALDRVAAEPASIGVTDLAATIAYAARHGMPAEQLEFHGRIARRCLFAYVQRGGWVRDLADIAAAEGAPAPRVGLAGTAADADFAALRRLDPGLAAAVVEPGAPEPLAAAAARGAVDALLLVADPGFDRALLDRLDADDRLRAIPVVTRQISRAIASTDTGFAIMPPRPAPEFLPWGPGPEPVPCTPVGVVLRRDAPPVLRGAVDRAVVAVAATFKARSLTDRALSAARAAFADTVGAIHGLLDGR